MQHTTALIAQRTARRRGQSGRLSGTLARRLGVGVGLLLVASLLAWGLSQLSLDTPAPKRQVARIALLPDTPPPPPPPPKEVQKQEQAPQPRPQPQAEDTPKPPAPANEPLKMEGAAGDGPSAFAAGSVTNDYRGGPVATGPAASGPGLADRAAERLYASSVRQLLQAEIERRLPAEAGELSASFALWVSAEGRIARWDADTDQAPLKAALAASADSLRLPAPPPSLAEQPMRFRLTVRPGA